jgi:hypothetical protein
MRPLVRAVLVLAALAAFQGVQACASETPDPGLNPQPLPPEENKDNVRDPEEVAQDPNATAGGSTSSSGGSSSGSPAADGDAGGADGGDSGGDN